MTLVELNLNELNGLLADQSYLGGFSPTQVDNITFENLEKKRPSFKGLPHIERWYKHITSFKGERRLFPIGSSTMGVKVRIFHLLICRIVLLLVACFAFRFKQKDIGLHGSNYMQSFLMHN